MQRSLLSSSTKNGRVSAALVVVIVGVFAAAGLVVYVMNFDGNDLYVISIKADIETPAEKSIRAILKGVKPDDISGKVTVDYPGNGTIFPPDFVPPTFLWHENMPNVKSWLVTVSFGNRAGKVYALVDGEYEKPKIDPRTQIATNRWKMSDYQASAKGWRPDRATWDVIQKRSMGTDADVTVCGVSGDGHTVSRGKTTITTSTDPVDAMVFYRDVPLMPSPTKDGSIKPLNSFALPLIKWRLRTLSDDEAPTVMQFLPTCANCHTFSKDASVLAMDMDGPSGDKGAYTITPVSKQMVITKENVFTWNDFKDKPKGTSTSGLFPQISPDGRYVATMLNEDVFVSNYLDYRFLQTFYPTRGIIVIYDRETEEMNRLPGADLTEYVQGNPTWSPDGKEIVFIRAKARDAYNPGPRPKRANDPEETKMEYDLYRIPFNGGKGGTATPVLGASSNGKSNSFPRFTPDGKWIVWVQARCGMLMRPDSELFIIPAEGGRPRKMKCNMLPMNSWHSFSPNSRWMVFSSKRNRPYTQMFLTHIDENGNDSPAILVPGSTDANRAVNLPEFVALKPGELENITTPAVQYRRHYERGMKYAKDGKMSEAVAEMEKSIELKSNYPDTRLYLAMMYSRTGQTDKAVENYTRLVEIDPNSFEGHHGLAGQYVRQRKNDKAIEHFRRAIEIDPDMHKARRNLASVLVEIRKFDEAIREIKKSLQGEPDSSDAYYKWGMVLRYQGKLAESVKRLEKALEIDVKHDQAWFQLGVSMGLLGRTDEALAAYRKAVEIDPKYFQAHRGLGDMLEKKGQPAEAVKHYRKAIEIDPRYFRAQARLAWVLSTADDDAVRNGKEAIRLANAACMSTRYRNFAYLDCLAAAYAETGQYKEAVRYAEDASRYASRSGNRKAASEIRERLELYKAEKPYRRNHQ